MQKYEIINVIGQGAYGVVLKCRSNQNKQIVAIKKFKQSQDDELVRKVTMRQVKILKNMKHPNIVELRDAFRRKGIVYLVFQYVQNNLLEVLEKSPDGLDPEHIKLIIYQILKGLTYMHSNNVVHRDIKPENLLISESKQLKICDFGFARSYKKADQQYTDYVATRWYRPPELLVGAPYDEAIDIWAVGCIMAELIDGNPLFPGENQFDQLFLIQKCLGTMTADHLEIFLKNPRFIGMKFPQIQNLQTIQKRYLGKLSQKALNFLKSTLKLKPSERVTAAEALKHPYFQNIRETQFSRKYSANNGHSKGQNRSGNSTKQQYPNSVSYQRKKIQTNMYNPSALNSNLQRQKTQQGYIQTHDNLFNTRGGKFYQQSLGNNANQSKINKKSKQDIRNFQLTTKGFNPIAQNNVHIHSKSVNKTNNNHQNVAIINNGNPSNKMSKLKEKYISLEKGQNHYNKRDHVTQTQAGFYKNKALKLEFPEHEQLNLIANNKNRGGSKVFGSGNDTHYPGPSKSRNAKNRSIINTQQIFQEDQGGLSSSQLPFLMIASQHTQGSNLKHSNPNVHHPSSNQQMNLKQKDSIKQKHKTNNGLHGSKQIHNHPQGLHHLNLNLNSTASHYLNNQPNNLNIIISNSIFNNYHQYNGSSNKNY